MTNLDRILKNRDIILPTKGHIVKAMVFLFYFVLFFPVVMYICDSWTINKVEGQRIDAFKLWLWRRLLRVTWTARKSNQSVLKEINLEYLWEGLMLKLKFQYFWPPDAKSWLTRKDPDSGKDWGQEEKGPTEDEMVGWHYWLNEHEFEQTLGENEGQGILACEVHGIAKKWTRLSNWTTTHLLGSLKNLHPVQGVVLTKPDTAILHQYVLKVTCKNFLMPISKE